MEKKKAPILKNTMQTAIKIITEGLRATQTIEAEARNRLEYLEFSNGSQHDIKNARMILDGWKSKKLEHLKALNEIQNLNQ